MRKKVLIIWQRVTDSFRMADIILLNNENIVKGNKNEELFLVKLK